MTNHCLLTLVFVVAECSSSPDCLNGGTCVRGACTCPGGYTGGKCGTVAPPGAVSGDVCSSVHPCANGGTCSPSSSGGEGACSCPTGYEGKRCQAACSTHEDCQNEGTCEARGCRCPAGYTGGKCETTLSGAGHVIIFPAAVLMSVVVQLILST
ncbi:multiple epidermal growth factor-like domains protein 10 [Haliotis rufescens]|uniref:multiple epidermal growth factor-like domains protein 10 n=1 Tax=Haliotis rufescens TaxID=6454 RepID=UPI00201E804F|nr:multiple epidermal growth factor-like domains protein 10 [Haliotis rufescens]